MINLNGLIFEQNPATKLKLIDYNDIHMEKGNSSKFNMSMTDVMVYLEIQKTGSSTFAKHLVLDIDLETPCICKPSNCTGGGRCKCQCRRPGNSDKTWLFSRSTAGWWCGIHADWTELTSCVDRYFDFMEEKRKRRYFYLTILRDPVKRFISELKFIRLGAVWGLGMEKHVCNGRPPLPEELPKCYSGPDWRSVKIDEFMNCSSNLAINRQTRMLADLELVNCYNRNSMEREERDRVMLQSAKENLLRMAFFGLTEMQAESQHIFEQTFNLKFKYDFSQKESSYAKTLHDNNISDAVVQRIEEINHLDMELYKFAKKVLLERFEELNPLNLG